MIQGPVVVFGGGGHARVVCDVLKQSKTPILGLVTPDSPSDPNLPWLGDDDEFFSDPSLHRFPAFVAIGGNGTRLALARRLLALNVHLASVISSDAIVSTETAIGRGVLVMPGAVVNAGTSLADSSIVNTGAVVDHDCSINSGAHIGPNASLAGWVSVGSEALVGVGATVIPKTSIGDRATVGAGAVVTRHVDADITVVGNPARPLPGRP